MEKITKPRILLFDVETKPVKCWIYRTGKQVIRHNSIVDGEKFDIICLAYKWVGEKKVTCLDWGREQNSAKMIEAFAKEVEKADVVLGQNSDSFDIKQVNTQRLLHNQLPIAWPVTEDLRKQVKKHFYVTSSSLEYMAKLLTGEGKDRMVFGDWVDIIERKDPKALEKMKKYCVRDVLKTEEVWKRIQPYVDPRAHRGVINGSGRNSCKSCGSMKIVNNGFKFNLTGKIRRIRCNACGYTGTNR